MWRSFGGLSVRRGKGENGEKLQGLRSTNWQVPNRQGDAKNSIGNGVAKELVRMINGHELRGGNAGGNGGARQRGIKGENGTSIIAQSIKYT